MPKKVREYLITNTMTQADAKRSYRKGIDIYERYRDTYLFDNDLEYNRAFLYDHAAIFSEKNSSLKRRYFEKAERIYTEILSRDKNHRGALNGMCRIYMEYRKDLKKALFYCKKLFASIKKLKKDERAVSCVGNVYLYAKDYPRAELWFKKDLVLVGRNNVAANVNLLIFYNTVGDYKRARVVARKVRELLRNELKKPIYMKIGASKTIENIFAHIEHAEKRAPARP